MTRWRTATCRIPRRLRLSLEGRVGKWIEIYWDYEPDGEYVHGHVDEEMARRAIEAGPGPGGCYDYSGVRHLWARYEQHGGNNGYDCLFVLHEEKGRGCFPVTEVPYRR